MDIGMIVNQIIWGLLIGITYSLLAIGFSIIYSACEAINFAQGEYAMLGAYFCYTAMSIFGANIILGALVALLLCLLFGSLAERIGFRRLYKLDHIYIVICTIGLSSILKNLVLIIWGPYSLNLKVTIAMQPIVIGGVIIPPKNLIILGSGIAVMVVFHLLMTRTKIGTAMRAVAQNKKAASLMGVDVKRMINFSWGLGALIAGIGGILIAFVYNLSIDMGGSVGIKGFAAAVLGGLGHVPGAMLGGLILGVTENLSAFAISYYYKDLIAFGMLIIVMLLKPSGLFIQSKFFRKI
jgi:branched-chain amino acid transport system permease protein